MLTHLAEEGVVMSLLKHCRLLGIVRAIFSALEWVDAHLATEVFRDARDWNQVD